MQLDWIWGKYGCAVVAADGCIYAPPYNARQAWGESYSARHAKHGWTWIWSLNLRPPWCSKVHGSLLHMFFRLLYQSDILWSCYQFHTRTILRINAADSADFGEGRNQLDAQKVEYHFSSLLLLCDHRWPLALVGGAVTLIRGSFYSYKWMFYTTNSYCRVVTSQFLGVSFTMVSVISQLCCCPVLCPGLIGPDLGDSTEAPRKYCSWKP